MLARFRPFRPLALAAALLGLAGCASLPPLPERTASTAWTDTRSTTLGRIAEASLADAAPGESGFRLLPTGDFALDARLALAARAERSLDIQYYQLQRDGVGLRVLRELAAGRMPLAFARAEVFADAPAKVDRTVRSETVATVARSTLEAIGAARREVLIASPYFTPARSAWR